MLPALSLNDCPGNETSLGIEIAAGAGAHDLRTAAGGPYAPWLLIPLNLILEALVGVAGRSGA